MHGPRGIAALFVFSALIGPRVALADGQALLINGGISAAQNHCVFVSNLYEMQDTLHGHWQTRILNADGDGTSKDSAQPDMEECENHDPNSSQIRLEPTGRKNPDGSLVLQNTIIPGAKPATLESINQWFSEMSGPAHQKDDLLVYFSDHGATSNVGIWDGELEVDDLRKFVQSVPADRKLVLVNDFCQSAGMLEALFQKTDSGLRPIPNRCGFAAAEKDELSLGGYAAKLAWEVIRNIPLSGIQDAQRALLKDRLKEMLEELKEFYSRAGIKEGASMQEIQALAENARKQKSELTAAYMETLSQINRAVVGYMTAEHPEQLKTFAKLDDELERLQEEKSKGTITEEESARFEKLSKESAREGNAILQTYNSLAAAPAGVPELSAWVKKNGGPGKAWPADLLERKSGLEAQIAKSDIDSFAKIGLANFLRRTSALESLIAHGTSEERADFIGLVECENTLI